MSDPLAQMPHDQMEQRLERHLMTFVELFRTGHAEDDQIRNMARLTSSPEVLVLRIGRDMHALTDEQRERYDRLVAERSTDG